MKRLAAILFFLIVFFNFYGYRLAIAYMQSSSDAAIQQKVDKNNYNDNELISIKTTLNLPYYTSSTNYERAYGSVTINGVAYEYVKRRVHNDTLELLCLPNQTKTNLQSVKNEITKSQADAPTEKKNHSTIKIPLPDFCQPIKTFSASCLTIQKQHLTDYISYLATGFILKHKKPPKAFSSTLGC